MDTIWALFGKAQCYGFRFRATGVAYLAYSPGAWSFQGGPERT